MVCFTMSNPSSATWVDVAMGMQKASGTQSSGNRERGFSLIELMVVVAIAAILMSVAIPSYRDYVRRGAIEEATSQLAAGRVVFEQFFLDNRTYEGAEASCPASTDRFAFDCGDPDATTYTITATGRNGMAGFVYTINEADTRTSDTLWGAGNCWITRKGETC